MEADGSGQHRVPGIEAVGTPSWSPDGTKIVYDIYMECDHASCSQICVVYADGTHNHCLTSPAVLAEAAPSWSPDGDRLVFVRREESTEDRILESSLVVMNADGSNQRQLTTMKGEELDPTWSPDGEKILFSSDAASDGDYAVYVIDVDGTDMRQLTSSPRSDYSPDWSPDGERIVFTRETVDRDGGEDDYWDLWVMDADGSDQHGLARTRYLESNAAWSPDGKQIVFICTDSGFDEICVMNADGTGRKTLTHDRTGFGQEADSPDWAQAFEGRTGQG